jgi:hypothetical protein
VTGRGEHMLKFKSATQGILACPLTAIIYRVISAYTVKYLLAQTIYFFLKNLNIKNLKKFRNFKNEIFEIIEIQRITNKKFRKF